MEPYDTPPKSDAWLTFSFWCNESKSFSGTTQIPWEMILTTYYIVRLYTPLSMHKEEHVLSCMLHAGCCPFKMCGITKAQKIKRNDEHEVNFYRIIWKNHKGFVIWANKILLYWNVSHNGYQWKIQNHTKDLKNANHNFLWFKFK